MSYNVFVSYSTKDGEAAKQLQGYLSQIKNVSVFLSETSLILGSLNDTLVKKIKECDLFIVLYSKNSHASRYVQQEIGVAKGNQKLIVPLLLDAEAKPDAMLDGLSYLSLYDETKRVEQTLRLYNYVMKQAEKKAITDAALALGAILLFGYALSKK